MRLVRIKPSYFRAFGDSDWINLDAGLVVLFGPNGYGKTSLAEAVEWLLYGKTKRRERGEALSQRDYQGSYRNAHAPVTSPTFVEAVIRLPDGTEHTIRRTLQLMARNAETSQTMVDGHTAPLSTVGFSDDEVFNPIVAQDSLQDFIHSKPKERRDKISAALGLDPLVRFKTAADRARTRFQNDPSAAVRVGQIELRRIIGTMQHGPGMRTLAARWSANTFDLNADATELQQAALDVLGLTTGDWPAITDQLQRTRADAVRCVFDDAPIRVAQDLKGRLAEVENSRAATVQDIPAANQAFNRLIESTVSQYSQAQLRLWESGLTIYDPQHPDVCPLCEEGTLREAKRTELRQRIDRSANYSTALRALEEQGQSVAEAIRSLSELAGGLLPTFLSDPQKTSLQGLFQDNPLTANVFLATHDSVRTAIELSQQTLSQVAQSMETLHNLAAHADTVATARQILMGLEVTINQGVQSASSAARQYTAAYEVFKPHLEGRIASNATVREIDGLLAPINGWHSVEVVEGYVRLLAELLVVIRQIEAHIQAQQAALLATRGQEINDWYDLMNPAASVRYSRMEAATDNLLLWAETYGVEVNAVACLSQCQLNCLGLSIHFVRALTTGTAFVFLLLDDPVQSMDDEHTQALIIDVIQELLNRNLQVIIFSHVQGLADQIWETYYNLQPLRLRISDYQQTGPVVEIAETLQQAISRAKMLAAGNEDNRRLAVKVTRRSVELLIRALCLQTGTQSPPSNAMAHTMLPSFRSCPGTNPQQAQGLQTTITFSNPAPHTQVGYAVPTQVQIRPHIDRIEQYAQTFGLV